MTNLMVRSATGRYRRACKEEVLEAAAQYLAASLQRSVSRPLTSPSAVEQFLVQALAPRDAEVFCIMFLDNRHRLIQFDEVFRSTIDGSSVHPREVVRRTLELNAAALILAHNHPSGIAEPSQADEVITRRLADASPTAGPGHSGNTGK
jgi:DNA repair protein RadC